MTLPLASVPSGALWWSIYRESSGAAPSVVAFVPIGASAQECKRSVAHFASRYQLRALDAKFRPMPVTPPRSFVVTDEEATRAQAKVVADALELLVLGARRPKVVVPSAECASSMPPPARLSAEPDET